jgi:orotidine-5'-phosphate decarboxylase
VTGKERLIAALDVADAVEALALARALGDSVGMLKVGLELFTAQGPTLVRELRELAPIFLDLKLNDIPNTVAGGVRAAADLGVRLCTVHAMAGRHAIRAARDVLETIKEDRPKLLAVTVLTSLSNADLADLGVVGSTEDAVVRLGALAVAAGADGLVCSPLEVAALRKALGPEVLLVVPGIRPKGAARGDQARVAGAAEARRAGADYLVVGRPLREATDPRRVAAELAMELDQITGQLEGSMINLEPKS